MKIRTWAYLIASKHNLIIIGSNPSEKTLPFSLKFYFQTLEIEL